MKIIDFYYRDREACTTGAEKVAVWRMYAAAMLEEMHSPRRNLSPDGLKLRSAEGDDERPVRYLPYWSRIPDQELDDLRDALIRARMNRVDE